MHRLQMYYASYIRLRGSPWKLRKMCVVVPRLLLSRCRSFEGGEAPVSPPACVPGMMEGFESRSTA